MVAPGRPLSVRAEGPTADDMLSPVAGDFDGDGTPDLVDVRYGLESTLLVRLGQDADGTVVLRRDHVPSGRILQVGPSLTVAGDFDGDGIDDLAGESFKCGVAIRLSAPSSRPCPADVDLSGVVDFDDLLWWARTSGAEADPIPPAADLDADGVVGFGDLLVLLGAWGDGPG